MWTTMLTTLFFLWASEVNSFTGLDCNNPDVSKTFAANNLQKCDIQYPNKIRKLGSRDLVLVQSDRLVTAPVRKCKLEYRPHIFNCGYWGDHVIEAGAYPTIVSIPENFCKEAFATRRMPLYNG